MPKAAYPDTDLPRHQGCGKLPYKSRAEAVFKIQRMFRRTRDRTKRGKHALGDKPMVAYVCEDCGFYHVGHPTERPTRQRQV